MQLDDKYPFNRAFRLKILSLMLDKFWVTQYGIDLIQPEYFESDDEEEMCRALIAYWEHYKTVPSDPEDIIVMSGSENSQFVYEIFDCDEDIRVASDKAIEWAREQSMKLAILESVECIKNKDTKNIIPLVKKALMVGDNLLSPGIDVIADTERWLYDIFVNKVRTGWTHVDRILGGGLSAGELGIILAPPNRGKSMGLINIGYGAAGIGSGKNVAHFTHEMHQGIVAKRYAARLTFRFPNKDENIERYEDDLIKSAMKLMPGKVRVIHQSKMTVDDMDNRLERMSAEGFNLGLIVDDYADLMVPTKRYTEKRYELSSIYEDLRALGDKWGVPVWSASQSNRASLSKELITMADIAEDIGKAAISDVIVAMCQTRDERLVDQCRLFMAKVRDGENLALFDAKYYSRSQTIITTGATAPKDNDQDV
jgi:hypothetical protein